MENAVASAYRYIIYRQRQRSPYTCTGAPVSPLYCTVRARGTAGRAGLLGGGLGCGRRLLLPLLALARLLLLLHLALLGLLLLALLAGLARHLLLLLDLLADLLGQLEVAGAAHGLAFPLEHGLALAGQRHVAVVAQVVLVVPV